MRTFTFQFKNGDTFTCEAATVQEASKKRHEQFGARKWTLIFSSNQRMWVGEDQVKHDLSQEVRP